MSHWDAVRMPAAVAEIYSWIRRREGACKYCQLDKEKANALLDEAGFDRSKPIDLWFNAGADSYASPFGMWPLVEDMTVQAMPTVIEDGIRISSSLVREALGSGDFARVADLLGRPYRLSGRVIHGRRLGRTAEQASYARQGHVIYE